MIVSVRPVIDLGSKPYWDYLQKKELRLQKCPKCHQFRFPPYPGCPYCGTPGGDWLPLSGKGKIYSWIVVHHPVDPRIKEDVPYLVVLVELDEGPRLVGRLVGCPPEEIKGEMSVKGKFEVIDDQLTLFNFESVQ